MHRIFKVLAAAVLSLSVCSVPVAQAEEGTEQRVDIAMGFSKAEADSFDPDYFPLVDGVGGFTREELEQKQNYVRDLYGGEEPVWQSETSGNKRSKRSLCQNFLPTNIQVCGGILQKYTEVRGPFGELLWPVEPMMPNPDGQGYRQRFANGFIYWHPDTGAHVVSTFMAAFWSGQGWEAGWMGYPKSDGFRAGERGGTKQIFQGGDAYISPYGTVGAVKGRIRDRFNELNGVDGSMGFPLTTELVTPDGRGRFNTFEAGGIYWTLPTDAHEVIGSQFLWWAVNGFEKGQYGYPVGNAPSEPFQPQRFEHGEMNIGEIFNSSPMVSLEGEPVNEAMSKMIGWLDTVDSLGFRSIVNGRDSRDSADVDYGGVLIPNGYRYYNDAPVIPKTGTNDYCTNSPSSTTGLFGKKVSFKGACAIHDMCYAGSSNIKVKVRKCDHDLYFNIRKVCENSSLSFVKGVTCSARARVYYDFVRAWQQRPIASDARRQYSECDIMQPSIPYCRPPYESR